DTQTLSLHDALPILGCDRRRDDQGVRTGRLLSGPPRPLAAGRGRARPSGGPGDHARLRRETGSTMARSVLRGDAAALSNMERGRPDGPLRTPARAAAGLARPMFTGECPG